MSRYWVCALLLAEIFLACALPEDWSRHHGPLSGLVAFMVDLIPSIAPSARISSFPNVTETYLSIVWLLAPVVFFGNFGLLSFDPRKPLPAGRKIRVRTNRWMLLLVAIPFFAVMLIVPLLGVDISPKALHNGTRGGWLVTLSAESRLWLGMTGALFCWMWTLGLLFVVLFIRNFRRIGPA